MNAILEANGLAKRFGITWALRDCDLEVPGGKVVGLVGPNGAGKTTLLHLAVGLLAPTSGSIAVLGRSPKRDSVALLSRVGFVAQDRPLYDDFTVDEMLEFGQRLNVRWDHDYALDRIRRFAIPAERRVRQLSTGQRAQVALTLALGKRPQLLLLDEPVANLDPAARLDLLEELMGVVAAEGTTVFMSSNALADVERVCEHLVILLGGRIRLAGAIDELVRTHALVVGPRLQEAQVPAGALAVRHAERQTSRLVRLETTDVRDESTDGTLSRPATLEEIVLAYMREPSEVSR